MGNGETHTTVSEASGQTLASIAPPAYEFFTEQNPLVSVVVPVYNVLPYLCQALDSVVSQTYRNLEVIIVDDGSTDGSDRVCDEYAERDSRIRTVHQRNLGLSAARNAGMDLATGVYLLFLDSDDWMEQNAIEALMRKATATGADIVCCQFFTERPDLSTRPAATRSTTYTGAEAVEAVACAEGITNSAWGKLYRADIFDGIRYPKGKVYEDVPITWRVLDRATLVITIPDALFHYRLRQGSIVHSYTAENTIDYWNAHKERLAALGHRNDKMRRSLTSNCMSSIWRFWISYLASPKSERAVFGATLEEMSVFAREHTKEVLTKRFPIKTKVLCLAGRWSSPHIWRFLIAVYFLRQKLLDNRTYD